MLLLGSLSFCDVYRGSDIVADFSGRIVMSQRTKKSDVAIVRAADTILDVVIGSRSDSLLKRIFHALQVFRLNRGEEAFKWNLRTAEIEAMHTNCFVRKVKVLSGNEVARKAADVSEALRLIEVGALPA